MIRAIEVYPQLMYGLDGVDGWPRILAILPTDYREMIDSAKAQIDLWVNLRVLNLVLVLQLWVTTLPLWEWDVVSGWLSMAVILLALLAVYALLDYVLLARAISAVIEWGNYVKSAFDLYRFSLLESMGLRPPKTRSEEKALWMRFSQAIIFNHPTSLPELKKPAEKGPPKKKK